MHSSQIIRKIKDSGIIPIVRVSNAEVALRAVEAILNGGITCVEITMTVHGALKALELVADRHGDHIILGAGTVLDPETARACMLAGAQFLVSPGLNLQTIEIAKRYGTPIYPGALTPTEILNAWEAGADGVKVFPCNAVGGAKYIKALKSPLPQVEMVPTGGVTLETIGEFFLAGASAVGVGSELVDSKSCAEGNYQIFTERAQQFREAVEMTRSKANL